MAQYASKGKFKNIKTNENINTLYQIYSTKAVLRGKCEYVIYVYIKKKNHK